MCPLASNEWVKGMRRRDVLASGAAVAVTGAIGVPRAQEMVQRPGEVVEVTRRGVCRDRDHVDPVGARRLLDEALVNFTGKPDPVQALAEYVHPEDVVGLKVNALASPGHPFLPALAFHLAEHLLTLGVPPRNIIVYDQYGDRMRKGGYRFVDRPGQVRVLHHRRMGYFKKEVRFDSVRALRWSNIIREVTAVLNLCVPKDHDLSGVTGALKNMAFGNIDRVPEFHKVIHRAIAWTYSQPEIRDKTRLCVCDATRVLYEGGPQDKPAHRVPRDAVLVAEDPVAMDWAVLDLVNAERVQRELQRIEDVRPPKFLHEAAARGLGDPFTRMRWTRSIDGASPALYDPQHVDRAFAVSAARQPFAGAGRP